MTLYVIELVRLFLPDSYATAFRAIEYVSGAVILILCFEKAQIFFRQGKKFSQGRKEPS
jgi:hypothetical protein